MHEQQKFSQTTVPYKSYTYYPNQFQGNQFQGYYPYQYGYHPGIYVPQNHYVPPPQPVQQPLQQPLNQSQQKTKLRIRDPETGAEVNLEELLKKDNEVKKDEEEKEKRKSIPGVPQEILIQSNKEEEEKKRLEAERKRLEEEEEKKKLEAERKRIEEEEEKKKLEAERKRIEEEEQEIERKRLEAEAAERKQREEEEAERKRVEAETERKRQEEQRKILDAERQRAAEERSRRDKNGVDDKKSQHHKEDSHSDDEKSDKSNDVDEWEKAVEKIEIPVDEAPRLTNKITYDRDTLLRYQLLVKPSPEVENAAKKFSIHRSSSPSPSPSERTPSGSREYSPRTSNQKRYDNRNPSSQHKVSPFSSKFQRGSGRKTPLVQLPPTAENAWIRPGNKNDLNMDIRRILNKISPQNYTTLLEKLIAIEGLDTFEGLSTLSSLIFEKAQKDTKYSELYSQLCLDLNRTLSPAQVENDEVKFRTIIVNLCAVNFKKRERPEPIPDDISDPVERDELEIKANKLRENLDGMMKFIGELYNKKMISGKHMIACLKELMIERNIVDLELFSS